MSELSNFATFPNDIIQLFPVEPETTLCILEDAYDLLFSIMYVCMHVCILFVWVWSLYTFANSWAIFLDYLNI